MNILDHATAIVHAYEDVWIRRDDKPVRGSNGAFYPYCPGCQTISNVSGRMQGCGQVDRNGNTH